MTLAKHPVDKFELTWRETLRFALELERPSLMNIEWLLDRLEHEERPSE